MADFPALEPATRRYGLGVYPTTQQATWGAASIGFRHSSTPRLAPLALTFTLLSSAEAQLIDDHFNNHGVKIPFNLPLITFRGNSSAGGPAPLSAQWRYIAPPEQDDLSGDLRNVTVQLECVG